MTDVPLRVERPADGVALLTLDLPDRRNAMTPELTAAWASAVADLAVDPALRAVVVTGSGKAFCAGGDLSWLGGSPDTTVAQLRERMLPFYRTWLAIRSLDVPVIAAVNGAAVGAGLCLALACDIRLASTAAVFSAPFVSLGIHAGMAATFLLPEAVGLPRARELLFTGRRVDAGEALQIGLCEAVHPPAELMPAALAVAAQIAAGAPVAVRLTKAALSFAGHRTIEEALAWEGLAQPVTMAGADLQEGLAAQAERRPPRFTGQ
ncbi:MAG TPA: enoyl-CoA hydratase/isomerase family protein [Mycobacteriales bacterium]|nr:enoyl-CoA hydratase/isomerase family protein [Mycobacteriales bacterium]